MGEEEKEQDGLGVWSREDEAIGMGRGWIRRLRVLYD
jgi:hypothetical protein